MGCSSSKLEEEEAVQLCKDRRRFIKQAVEQRTRFASGHLAYIHALRRVSAALRSYFEADEHQSFPTDSFITPPFTPVKKANSGFISASPQTFSPAKIKGGSNASVKVHYMRSGGNQTVSVEEKPRSSETYRVQAYSPVHVAMQSSPMESSYYSYYPSYSSNVPPSPQASQWDSIWNPFSSLDYYGYPNRSSLDHMVMEDDARGLRRVREEEGIPDLEDETEQEDINEQAKQEGGGGGKYFEEEEEVEEEDANESIEVSESESGCECECENIVSSSQNAAKEKFPRSQNMGKVEIQSREVAIAEREVKAGKPGFTVYVNRRPTCMAEVVRDLEDQFRVICNSANEVSSLMESDRAQYLSASSEHSALKMLNPVALFRSASSLSSSSRYLLNSSSTSKDERESGGDFSEESGKSAGAGSHQSTLDRLYVWEKKLYEEVKSGEKVRLAYEKRCAQLRSQDASGDDPTAVDKTRAAIGDLHTQIKVSIHSVESISKRIEALRDEELQPQLVELVKGLSRMWKVMEESHRMQKRTLDEAKLLLANAPSKSKSGAPGDPQHLARSAANLEAEVRNWRACFDWWIASQRAYVHALCGWLLRCLRSSTNSSSSLLLSPRRSGESFPIFGLCMQWKKFLDAVNEKPVLDGIEFFAAGMGYVNTHHLREDRHRVPTASRYNGEENNMELVEYEGEEEGVASAKMLEISNRILCAGMSVAVSSLSEFSISLSEGFADLAKQWENAA